jgi:hypothetical protein
MGQDLKVGDAIPGKLLRAIKRDVETRFFGDSGDLL